jgi:hypothetical protein
MKISRVFCENVFIHLYFLESCEGVEASLIKESADNNELLEAFENEMKIAGETLANSYNQIEALRAETAR